MWSEKAGEELRILFLSKVLLVLILVSLTLTSVTVYTASTQRLVYNLILEGTYSSSGLGALSWRLQGTLEVVPGPEPRFLLRINYFAPMSPNIYSAVKPKLEELLRGLKSSMELSDPREALKKPLLVVLYSEDLKEMVKCKADVSSKKFFESEEIILYTSDNLQYPLAFELKGDIKGYAQLTLAKGFSCGQPLVTGETKRAMLYVSLGITLMAIIAFIFRPRLKEADYLSYGPTSYGSLFISPRRTRSS